MNIVSRATNIITHPSSEWPVIAAETTSAGGILAGYVVPLAAIGPIASFIRLCVIGVGVPFVGTYRTGLQTGLVQAALAFFFTIAGMFVVAAIVNGFAASFSGRKSWAGALKVTAYSYTPAFLAGIVFVFPVLSLLILVAGLYGIYLLYSGLPILMGTPKKRAPLYTLTVVASAIVVGLLIAALSLVGPAINGRA